MKKLLLLAGFSLAALFSLAAVLWLATPEAWPIQAGSLRAKKVAVDGQTFVLIDGQPMNCLGQIQSINVTVDLPKKTILVSRCLIRKNPFTRISVNNQWPQLYPVQSLPPGKYSVEYQSTDGNALAGTIEVP